MIRVPPAGSAGRRDIGIAPEELAALVLQSILLAASLAFVAAILLSRLTPMPRPIAFGLGFEVGLLVSYPTMRIVARANGSRLGFWKWLAVTIVPAVLGITILSVV